MTAIWIRLAKTARRGTGILVLASLPCGANANADVKAVERVKQTLSDAASGNRSRVELKYSGPVPAALVEAVATHFVAEAGDAAAGVTAELATQIRCGYRSPEYAKRLTEANGDKFDGQVIKGPVGSTVSLVMPACLVAPVIHAHRIAKDETAQILAAKFYRQAVATDEFCQMLLAANARNICADSRDKKLRIDDIVRLVLPSLERQHQEMDGLAFRTLRMARRVDIASLATILVSASESNRLQVLPQASAELIVPSKAQEGTCTPGEKPPFDPTALADAFLRPNRTINGRNQYQRVEIKWQKRVPTVGIIDTGLYRAVLERLQAESGGPPELLSLSGTIDAIGSNSAGFEPSAADDFAGHGTHISGLVLGGGAFWKTLIGKPEGPLSYMLGNLSKLVFIKVTSHGAHSQPPTISTDVVRRALEHIYKDVEIINFSHKAPFSESLKEKLVSIAQQDKFVVSAAGNDNDNMDEYSADEPQLSAMLSGDVQKFFITVGAANQELTAPASFSNTGSRMVDLFAAGTCIESLGDAQDDKRKYVFSSGTSQAAPLVTFTLTLLHQMMMPRKELKFRILDTVDYEPGFADVSISGGVLNIPKALDFFDDIVVLNKAPKGTYARGRLVMVTPDKMEHPDAYLCMSPKQNAVKTLAHNTLMRSSRRVVIVDGVAKIVPEANKTFKYHDCPYNPDIKLRLKNSNLPDIYLSEVKEIIPRPNWWLRAEQ
ncbi:MAG: S8 family serine peptidase [Rhodospirillales bacterium]|nr:S8 family serine peptidase [Rhodospirillales bacterium]